LTLVALAGRRATIRAHGQEVELTAVAAGTSERPP